MLDWISDMEKFFEYENTLDNRKVKILVTRLKDHASLWWEHLQTDRQRRGKEKIRTWPKIVNKVKNKFLPANSSYLVEKDAKFETKVHYYERVYQGILYWTSNLDMWMMMLRKLQDI